MILVGALLPGGIAVAVPDVEPLPAEYGFCQLVIFKELRAVVCGDAAELLPEALSAHVLFQPVEYGPHRGGPFIRQIEDRFLPGIAFGQSEQRAFAFGAAHH